MMINDTLSVYVLNLIKHLEVCGKEQYWTMRYSALRELLEG